MFTFRCLCTCTLFNDNKLNPIQSNPMFHCHGISFTPENRDTDRDKSRTIVSLCLIKTHTHAHTHTYKHTCVQMYAHTSHTVFLMPISPHQIPWNVPLCRICVLVSAQKTYYA